MFNVGDKVICLLSSISDILIKDQIYTISRVSKYHDSISLEGIPSINYSVYRFMLLSKHRKKKIKKICSKLDTK